MARRRRRPTPAPSFDPARFRMGEEASMGAARPTSAGELASLELAQITENLSNIPTNAEIDAIGAQGDTFAAIGDLQAQLATLLTEQAKGQETKVTPPPINPPPGKRAVRQQYFGAGASRILRVFYDDGSYEDFPAPEAPEEDVGGGDLSQILDLLSGQRSSADTLYNQMLEQMKKQQEEFAASQARMERQQRESAIAVLTERFGTYGLTTLIPKIRELAIEGATEATITLQLMETEEYKRRFRANQDRIKKNLAVLSPGDYLNLEDKYRQILRAYGLRQFDTDDYVTQFIANDVSTAELSSRVQLAVQRVQNADPAVLNTLNRFYGIGNTDLVAYALDPETQFQKIERQVAAAEIGAAAGLQGFAVDKSFAATAEQLAAQGVTQAEARKGYATIADILPTAEKLSQIYGSALEGYGLAEAEQEVFNQLASAQRRRQRLAEREAASFAGQSGLGRTSLTSQLGGTF